MRAIGRAGKGRRILAALTLAAALGGTAAQAQGPRANTAPPQSKVIVLEYEVHVIGLRTLTVDTITRIDGSRYQLDMSVRNEGVLRALTAAFGSRNQAIGTLGPAGVTPGTAYTGIAVGRDFKRSWIVRYLPDGSLDERHTNLDQPEHFKPTPAQKKGAVDPATGLIVAAFSPGGPCNRTIKMFDSKRRFDLVAGPATKQVLPDGFTTLFSGETNTCEMRMKKIAGYGDGNPKDQATDDDPIRVWLGRLDDSGIEFPVRVTLSTGWGTLVGRLKKREIRAFRPEDYQAMNR
ncbi:MAG: DUF3108 domain-containing protein [Alphaproteobacteria bacterium]|nr:DUF3108 domain-containing protein [Alphaproteobacteria bacterium]MCW5742863.1 DUF3108 domain-containing protein [Alphaproteobacteria bacterium]